MDLPYKMEDERGYHDLISLARLLGFVFTGRVFVSVRSVRVEDENYV